MRWLTELWAKSSTAAQIALVVGLVAVIVALLYFGGGLDALGAWLGTN